MTTIYVERWKWVGGEWPSYIIKSTDQNPPEDLKELCDFKDASIRRLSKSSRLSDFVKQEFNISKSQFKRLLNQGGVKRPVPWNKKQRELVKEDILLKDLGIDSFKIGSTKNRIKFHLWFYTPVRNK